MRMLQWILGTGRRYMIRNKEIRRKCGTANIVDKMREVLLTLFEHMRRREGNEPARMALKVEVEGHREKGRPSKRWIGLY